MKKFAPVSSTTTKNFKSITFTVQELFHEQATVLYFEMDSSLFVAKDGLFSLVYLSRLSL